ncbi:MAG: sugar phosphate isomerase/epimerase [Victivallales bacterium]|nr:sugar phosphate isomerase/epimerase [Victivallales bacterium]
MSTSVIGTLLRCGDIDERRIAYYQKIGLNALQIAGVYEDWLAPCEAAKAASDAFFQLFAKYGIAVPTMFLSFPNQDWKHPREGVGLVPAATRSERMILSCRQMNWAKRYGIRYITCHVGFVPEERDAFYERLIADLKQLARFAAANGQDFLFETGTESAASMKQIVTDIDEPNVGINFDPANMLIYGTDTPANLLDSLADKIRVVHCKDAVPAQPGDRRGKETVLGKGATNFTDLLKKLLAQGFDGPLIIERELPLGPEQEKDIAEAVSLIKSII